MTVPRSRERSTACLLDACPIALDAGEYTPDAAGSLTALWRERGIGADQRLGAFNYDPIGTLAATGALYHPLPRALEIAASLALEARQQPGVTALAVNGHVWHKGGATEAQELALVLASLVAYLRACEAKGLAPHEALGSIALTLAVDADQMLGLAKFRAARRLIARVLEACGAAQAAATLMIGAETSARMMAKRDPWVNILRTTMATATAAMAGACSITVQPFTWALGKPDAFARRVARNTHHVLIEEAGLARVGDPAAGSFAIEALTTDLAATAWTLFRAIEANGGIAAGLQSGSIQNDLQTSHATRARLLAEGWIEMTGASAYPLLGTDDITVEPWPVEPLPAELNGARVTPLDMHRLSEPFEALRDRADVHATRTGTAPTIFLATLGDAADFAQRASWTRNFLAAGGIATSEGTRDQGGFSDTRELGAAFGGSGARVACLCAADATYAEIGEAAAAVLKQAGAEHVVVAGRPKDQDAGLRAAGVDAFMYAGCNRSRRCRHCMRHSGSMTDAPRRHFVMLSCRNGL